MSQTTGAKQGLASSPAAPPPLGVTPNFNTHDNTGDTYVNVCSIFMCIMLLLVSNRVYTKYLITKNVSWDDCESLKV